MSKDPKSTYYDAGGIETIDIIKAKLTPEQFLGFCLGNLMKYDTRINFKSPQSKFRDAEKIKIYSELVYQQVLEIDGMNEEEVEKMSGNEIAHFEKRIENLKIKAKIDLIAMKILSAAIQEISTKITAIVNNPSIPKIKETMIMDIRDILEGVENAINAIQK